MQNLSTNQEILVTILLDMQASGVNDIVSEKPFNMFAKSIILQPVKNSPKIIKSTHPVVKKVDNTVLNPIANKPIANEVEKPEEHVWLLNQSATTICIAYGESQGNEPFNGNEKALFTNMLKATGLAIEEIGYLVIDNRLYIEDNREGLTKVCRRLLSASKAQVIISFGENMCPILMGGNVSLSGVRGFGKEVAGIRYVATYSPRSLLNQPLLKRLAWQDLQIAMGYLKVLAND